MRRWLPAVAVLLLAATAARAQDEDPERVHIRMSKRISPSVVFVSGGGQAGSGVCVDKDGYILTSPTACGPATETATVILPGHKQVEGKVIGRDNDRELVVLKVDATLPAVEFGDSDEVKVGQIAYVFGDSYGSIQVDDQVSMSLGVVSAKYELSRRQRGAYYTGPVIETSAAVNPNQDGGPMIDAKGRLIGLVSLNYEDSKFTGVAVPSNRIRGDVEAMIRKHKAPSTEVAEPKNAGWLGAAVEVVEDEPGVRVSRVSFNSPAEKAGLKVGDLVTRVGGRKVLTRDGFDEAVSRFAVGAKVELRIERDGKAQTLTVTLGKRNEY